MPGPIWIGQTGNWVTKSRVLQNTYWQEQESRFNQGQGQAFHPAKPPAVCHGFLHTKSGANQILAHAVDERSDIQDGMVAETAGSRNGHELRARTSIAANEHYSQGCWGAASAELSHHQPLDGSTVPVVINASRLQVLSCAREAISNGLEGRPGVAAARINETADNP
ncbi:uncharacterized protein FPRO_01324 [Fusarium proliferatum ET1]|uniref:Uncharacterized protein n=1 Tax=Fusarium proliferatum (strain ET1) TaxID=1227346 RepID=A0A1L7V5K0_FUSPR|nr:uncharacterized protein FPRO_01324 [Fusarium proliferatum ET1]CZR34370.1 uncharacterized protein FPRO_01324 [Fusarium proliferatum ET1]